MAENFSVLTSPLCLDDLSTAKRVQDTVGESLVNTEKFETNVVQFSNLIMKTRNIFFLAYDMAFFSLDKVLPHIHINFKESEGIKTPWHKTTLLVLAITLHNIPEGLAVGVLFGGVAAGIPEASISGAVALAIGIGIQNFPEGIAVSMPMRRQGVSRFKSFWYGQLSAIVEPIAAVIGALAVTFFTPILPYALAFAAGAMIFVVVEEVIPETQQDQYTDTSTIGFIIGFVVMMVLDVALG